MHLKSVVVFYYETFFLGRVVNRMGIPLLCGPRYEYNNGDNRLVFGVAVITEICTDITPIRTGPHSRRQHSEKTSGN